jgi:hypothetical protein
LSPLPILLLLLLSAAVTVDIAIAVLNAIVVAATEVNTVIATPSATAAIPSTAVVADYSSATFSC